MTIHVLFSNITRHRIANYVIIIKARSLPVSIEVSIERRWECIFDAVRGFDHTLNLQGNHGIVRTQGNVSLRNMVNLKSV